MADLFFMPKGIPCERVNVYILENVEDVNAWKDPSLSKNQGNVNTDIEELSTYLFTH